MKKRQHTEEKAEFKAGLNHSIQSAEKADEAGARSRALRAPLHDPSLDGTLTKGRIRPLWVGRHLQRLEELAPRITEAISWEKAKEREAGEYSSYWPWLLVSILLVIADGFLLAPIISNAVGGYENSYLTLGLGLSAACLIALAGWSCGWMCRAWSLGRWGKILAALLGGLGGMISGGLLGWAGDGTLAGTLLRIVLTGASGLSMAVVHFIVAESQEVWGAVKVARKQRRDYESERDLLEGALVQYQEQSIRENEAFNRSEADRHDGLKSGEQARSDWVRPSYKNICLALVFSLGLGLSPHSVQAEEALHTHTILVLDITDSAEERTVLAEEAQSVLRLGYGDSIRVLLLGCNGLTPVFEASVAPITQARHRQDLHEVKARLAETLKTAVEQASDTRCSPIADTLLMLAAEWQLRQSHGGKVKLVIASDFETNTDRFKLTGHPFVGADVEIILRRPIGRDMRQRMAALDFIQRLFAGASLTIHN